MRTPPELPQPGTLGWRLRRARADRSLKSVADEAQITAAYLQKLERNNVQKPSPNVLHALGSELGIPYDELMELAGYVAPSGDASRVKEGNVLAYALSSERLTEDEAAKLLEYLDWYRHRKASGVALADAGQNDAKLARLRRERDEARAEAEKLRDFTVTGDELDRALDRAEAAEAQAARYRGALERLRALGCDEEVELEGEDSEFAAQTWLIADEALGGGDD